MAAKPRLWTAEDFFELPGREKIELWYGQPTGPKAMERRLSPFCRSMAELRLIQYLSAHVFRNDLGLVGPGFGFVTAADRAQHPPDLAFIRRDRMPREEEWDGLSLVVPDLAIEILSPVDESEQMEEHVQAYLAGGVPLLWVVDSVRRLVVVHEPNEPPRTLEQGDELDGGDVVPGFRVAVAELFQ